VSWIKVEAPIVNHLSDLGADVEECEVMEIFPMLVDTEYGDC